MPSLLDPVAARSTTCAFGVALIDGADVTFAAGSFAVGAALGATGTVGFFGSIAPTGSSVVAVYGPWYGSILRSALAGGSVSFTNDDTPTSTLCPCCTFDAGCYSDDYGGQIFSCQDACCHISYFCHGDPRDLAHLHFGDTSCCSHPACEGVFDDCDACGGCFYGGKIPGELSCDSGTSGDIDVTLLVPTVPYSGIRIKTVFSGAGVTSTYSYTDPNQHYSCCGHPLGETFDITSAGCSGGDSALTVEITMLGEAPIVPIEVGDFDLPCPSCTVEAIFDAYVISCPPSGSCGVKVNHGTPEAPDWRRHPVRAFLGGAWHRY